MSAQLRPLVAVELHDVAPATWPQCRALLDMLDSIGARHVTLLVVPFYHRTVAIDRSPAFIDAIGRRLAHGDEAAVHGFVHLDEAPSPRTPRGFVARRLLTRCEGEFAALGHDDASARIDAALECWRRAGLPLTGFVPPAWLASDGARAAIERAGSFRYVSLRRALVGLPHGRTSATDVLWYSPTSAVRRSMSRAMISVAVARASPQRLLRIALHPQDAAVASVVEHWRDVVARMLAQRTPVTLGEAVARMSSVARRAPRPVADGDSRRRTAPTPCRRRRS